MGTTRSNRGEPLPAKESGGPLATLEEQRQVPIMDGAPGMQQRLGPPGKALPAPPPCSPLEAPSVRSPWPRPARRPSTWRNLVAPAESHEETGGSWSQESRRASVSLGKSWRVPEREGFGTDRRPQRATPHQLKQPRTRAVVDGVEARDEGGHAAAQLGEGDGPLLHRGEGPAS